MAMPAGVAGAAPGAMAVPWSEDEMAQLRKALAVYPSSAHTPVVRCIKIAALIDGRSVRDVAAKLSELQQHAATRRAAESSSATTPLVSRSVVGVRTSPPHAAAAPVADHTAMPMVTSLLQANEQLLQQMQMNLVAGRHAENIPLMARFRDCTRKLQEWLTEVDKSNMPPLPVELNTALLPPSKSNVYTPRGGGHSFLAGLTNPSPIARFGVGGGRLLSRPGSLYNPAPSPLRAGSSFGMLGQVGGHAAAPGLPAPVSAGGATAGTPVAHKVPPPLPPPRSSPLGVAAAASAPLAASMTAPAAALPAV